MGRQRKDTSQGLAGTRLYLRHGTFYYVHRDGGRWENVGKDLAAAKKRADHYNDPTGTFGLMAWYLDQFIIECEARAKAGDLLKRVTGSAATSITVLHQPLIHTLKGDAYTYGGISSMLKRVIVKVRQQVPALKAMPSFGFRDLKGKGATDMWQAGTPIEQIQQLCGHKTKTTTERYIKARWNETAAPNTIVISG